MRTMTPPTRREFVLGLLAATACGPGTVDREAPGMHELSDRIKGRPRASQLFIPEGLTGLVPMVMALPDTGDTPESMIDAAGWKAECTRRGWVGVFPTFDKDGPQSDNIFLTHLMMRATALGGVDPKRVFLVGHGEGGRRAYAMAVAHADMIAAIGASGAPVRYLSDDQGFQDPEGAKLSVIHVHGGKDVPVPVEGGPSLGKDATIRAIPPIDDALKPWVDHLGATEAPAEIDVPERVRVKRWAGSGHSVVRVIDPEQDHGWNDELGTRVIADFFAAAPPRT